MGNVALHFRRERPPVKNIYYRDVWRDENRRVTDERTDVSLSVDIDSNTTSSNELLLHPPKRQREIVKSESMRWLKLIKTNHACNKYCL